MPYTEANGRTIDTIERTKEAAIPISAYVARTERPFTLPVSLTTAFWNWLNAVFAAAPNCCAAASNCCPVEAPC